MLKRILMFSAFWAMFFVPKLFYAQTIPPFNCPIMVGLLNEGPAEPEQPSYITIITPSTGSIGTQLAVTDITTGLAYKSLNGVGIVNTDGYAYAQYQAIPNRTQVLLDLLAGNYTSTSSLVQIGSNGKAQTLGTLTPPINTGFNAHVMLGLLGSADNSGNYLVASIEAQVNPIDTSVSAFKLYIGKVAVPSGSVVWSAINLDASCTAFQQSFIDALKRGEDRGAQDMVWDYNTNKLFLYAGVDRILSVVDLTSNVGSCYVDNNGVQQTGNLGGLALDSVGQMIGLEVQTGRVFRIDTRGCIDGNPGTPCINSITNINSYTINGNEDTRGDAASCVVKCVAPIITKSDVVTCVDKTTTLNISVSGASNPYTYVWGNYAGNGTLSNTTAEDASYIHNTAGSYKAYVTVSDNKGCQSTDSINIVVNNKLDTVKSVASLCAGDSISFGTIFIKTPGTYVRTLTASTSCDSIIELTVTAGTNCGTIPPFNCPIMVGLLNEGPAEPEQPSYITVITPSTGSIGTQLAVTDITTGLAYKSLNGVGIVNTDGYAYAQYQAIPNRTQVLLDLLAGNYTSISSLVQIGSNGKAQTLGTLTPPINTGFNAHVMLGLLGSADNSGNYLVASIEAQVNPIDTSVSAFKLYIGKVAVPSGSVVWSAINLDASCTAFQQSFIDALKRGEDRGAQDMVWDYNTNKLFLYAGVDRILSVVDLTSNVGSCYADNNGVQQTGNLGGLALDSVGQMIGLEVQTGRVFRIDTRGCIDGNPGTPCINSITNINSYTINGNEDTRGDAASCVPACTPPTITKQNTLTCVNTPVRLSVNVTPTNGITYTWGIYSGNGTLVNTNSATPLYSNSVAGNYKVYVTVENAQGCQATDSFMVSVVNKPDTTFINNTLCSNKEDSIIFNGQIIKQAGIYLVSLVSNAGCDSLVKLTVIESVCNTNPPVAVNNDTITFGSPVVINVLGNDYDVDGDTITVCAIITNPKNGSVQVNQDGTITYTPSITSGIDSFQYMICSKDGDSTAWVIITIEDCIIPNTFSPNGDGKNDIFEIPCIDGSKGSLCVFNRWGAQVFRNDHYDNISGAFDGKYKGEDLPDGTYYYVLKYNSLQGKNIDRAGFVVIHRSSK